MHFELISVLAVIASACSTILRLFLERFQENYREFVHFELISVLAVIASTCSTCSACQQLQYLPVLAVVAST